MDSNTKVSSATADKPDAAAAKPDAKALIDAALAIVEAAESKFRSVRLTCGSRALAVAVENGLEPRMCYCVADAAKIIGLTPAVLREEIGTGRLRAFKPAGLKRESYIKVTEIDRWMEEREPMEEVAS